MHGFLARGGTRRDQLLVDFARCAIRYLTLALTTSQLMCKSFIGALTLTQVAPPDPLAPLTAAAPGARLARRLSPPLRLEMGELTVKCVQYKLKPYRCVKYKVSRTACKVLTDTAHAKRRAPTVADTRSARESRRADHDSTRGLRPNSDHGWQATATVARARAPSLMRCSRSAIRASSVAPALRLCPARATETRGQTQTLKLKWCMFAV